MVALLQIKGEREEIEFPPPLSAEEERTLFQRLEGNHRDQSIRNQIVEGNLRLVAYWVKRIQATHSTGNLKWEDLFQEGCIGLIKAVEKFDWRKGYKFSTYATWWIYQTITRAIENTGFPIKIPTYILKIVKKRLKIREELSQKLGYEPPFEMVTQRLKITSVREETFRQALASMEAPASLDRPVSSEEEGSSFLDLIEDPCQENSPEAIESKMMQEALCQMIKLLLKVLDEEERRVIRLRFGLDDRRTRSLREAGKELSGLNYETVRQIQKNALKKMRKAMRENHPEISKQLKELLI